MCNFISLHIILCSVLFGLTSCTSSFDQRQTGDLNVQIGLRNIQLIALLKGRTEDYVDYDYAYDYSEMTIKPQNGTTTPKPLNVTSTQTQNNVTTLKPLSDNATESTTVTTEQVINVTEQSVNTTEVLKNATESGMNATAGFTAGIANQTINIGAANNTLKPTTRKVENEDGPTTVSSDSSSAASTAPVATTTNCRRGFVQNNQGKCEYKVQGTSNALRRIVKLAQKIKIGRGYKGT